ncbi:MAG TPA: hydrolase [Xanthobacteraceae bacterium]
MQLEAKSTALILIDLQKGVMAMPVMPHSAVAVYERSMRLAERFRAKGAPVVRVRVSFSSGFADALQVPVDRPTDYSAFPPGWDEFPEPLAASDLAITKRQWGAFYGTDLDLQLRRRGVRRIVLGGIATNIGVESTARAAAEHGYELVIAEDLCSSLSAETHAFSIEQILPRLARITSAEKISLA